MAIQFLRGKTTEINQATTINLQPGQPLLDTTKGCLYINADPNDTAKKVSDPSAFTKFPSLKSTTKGFVEYDGTNYTTTTDVVKSIGGVSGDIRLGGGLTLADGTLSATNTSSTSINGLTGTVSILGAGDAKVTTSGQAITISMAKVKSVTDISNEYQATDVEGNLTIAGWVSNASEAGFSATKKYLYVRQTTKYSDQTSDVRTFINSVWGADGTNGKDGTSVTIKGSYESEEEWNAAVERGEPVAEPGSAYLVAGDLYVWVLEQGSESGSWQNVGKIQGPQGPKGDTGEQGPKGDKGDTGAAGTGATITFGYKASTTDLPSAGSSDWDDDLQTARGKLDETKPILWCKEIVKDALGESSKIYILETLPYKTYIKYADIGAFNTTTFEPIGTPDIYDTPKSTTGWMGTYSGYAQTAPIAISKYKWAYYLTEINRTNFMANVIDNAKDTDGNYIDGIYTKEGSGGKKYIGINASAINTGSLKVTDGSANTIFNASISDKKVDIAGWNVSEDQISKNGVGLYSGTASTATSLADSLGATTSPVRFFAGSKDVTTVYIGTLGDDGAFTSMQEIASSYIIDTEVFNKYIKINLNESFFAVYDYIRLNSEESTITYTKADNIDKITGSGSIWKSGLFYFENQSPTALNSAVCSLYLSTDKASDWYRFKVLEDGSLYASAASIEGNIKATSGTVGNFIINPEENNGYLQWVPTTADSPWQLFIGGPTSEVSSPRLGISKITSPYQRMNLQANSLSFQDGSRESDNEKTYTVDFKTKWLTDSSPEAVANRSKEVYPAIIANKLFIGSTLDKSTYKPSVGIKIHSVTDEGLGIGGELIGSWTGTVFSATTSSRNKKHDIEELDNRYSTLLDNLKPVRFKYNDGVSNRYHTGLILDEMKNAMDTAQIDSSEFAAYCVQDEKTGDGGIRYEELIALLIKEVQELKRKIR